MTKANHYIHLQEPFAIFKVIHDSKGNEQGKKSLSNDEISTKCLIPYIIIKKITKTLRM